jgi:hypothetical protein
MHIDDLLQGIARNDKCLELASLRPLLEKGQVFP